MATQTDGPEGLANSCCCCCSGRCCCYFSLALAVVLVPEVAMLAFAAVTAVFATCLFLLSSPCWLWCWALLDTDVVFDLVVKIVVFLIVIVRPLFCLCCWLLTFGGTWFACLLLLCVACRWSCVTLALFCLLHCFALCLRCCVVLKRVPAVPP